MIGKSIFKILVLFISVFALTGLGCSDRTTDDYQRDKLNQSLNTYQGVAGTYTGVVKSNKTNEILGAIELGLQVQTKTSTSNTGDITPATPILISNIRFFNTKVIQATAQSSFYDPTTKQFHTEITITRSSQSGASNSTAGQTETISLTGSLDGDSFVGEIKDLNDPDYSATLNLSKNGTEIEKLAAQNMNQNSGLNAESLFYTGQTQFGNQSRQLNVILVLPVHQNAEDLLNIFSATRDVSLNFNYGKSLHINFPNVLWDRRQGLMTGRTTLTRNTQTLELSVECNLDRLSQLKCKDIVSNSSTTFLSTLNQVSQAPTDPTDSDASQETITRIYPGSGKIGGKTVNDFKLSVSTISATALDQLLDLFFPKNEETLGVSFNAGEGVSIYFSDVRWDIGQGTLDGQFSSAGADPYTSHLKCTNFYFTEMKANTQFSCHYWTNRSPDIFVTYSAAPLK